MEDEYAGVIIIEFIGLKAKMYSITKIDGGESSTAKGVNIAKNSMNLKMLCLIKKLLSIK